MSLLPRLLAPCRRRAFSTIPPPPPLPPTRARRLLYSASFLLGASAGVLLYNYSPPAPPPPPSLNPHAFTPYTLTSHTPIATSPPQSSILTLLGPPPGFSPAHLQSVETKHPALQIARSYTPLPSSDDGTIRLLIKLEPSGEMSRYIFSLPPSSAIEIRGPHNEYTLPPADTASRTLFLAGGTGIAPALQGAEKVLGASDTAEMRILWAVRRREETTGEVGEVVRGLERKFGGRLEVGVYVDTEGGIRKEEVREAVKGVDRVLVCGPDGFVEYWVGRKGRWVRGVETQGVLGGVLKGVVGKEVEVWKL
ncbi:hypothetical protein K440DRAFT_599657 [Wilcoxina mikolae CBS 423.85]|nr:hypothetical protein K440DRAFT_599657 [Wilcoxina mikolae CBS 423.85]